MQDIEAIGKNPTFGNNIALTPDECAALKRYATNGIIAKAENKKLREKLTYAEKSASAWKQRYDALNEKYQELKKKALTFLEAMEIAPEKVRAFLFAILARRKETQEHAHNAHESNRVVEYENKEDICR